MILAVPSDIDAFAIWRRFGALGKVHKSVKWIMQSDQHRQAFIALQSELKDNNSLFKEVEKVLVKDGGVQ